MLNEKDYGNIMFLPKMKMFISPKNIDVFRLFIFLLYNLLNRL